MTETIIYCFSRTQQAVFVLSTLLYWLHARTMSIQKIQKAFVVLTALRRTWTDVKEPEEI